MSHPLGLEPDQINPDLPEENTEDYVVLPTRISDFNLRTLAGLTWIGGENDDWVGNTLQWQEYKRLEALQKV